MSHIRPGSIRPFPNAGKDAKTAKGYYKKQFEAAWESYFPAQPKQPKRPAKPGEPNLGVVEGVAA